MTTGNYGRIFRLPAFRAFWAGFTCSVLGDAMTRVALTWYVFELTRSAEALGWLMFWYTGPVVVGGLLAGALLDRFDRRMVILVDSLLRGIAVATVPLLYALGRLALWHIYVVAGVYGLLMMIALAGAPALFPALVPREQLATANALEMLGYTLAGVVGPVIAGLLIGWVGAPNVLIIDVLSYLGFAAVLWSIRHAPMLDAGPAQPGRSYSIWDAVRLLFGSAVLGSTTLMFLIFNIGGGFLAVWLPILADQIGGAGVYGTLLGILAGGEVLSTLVAGSRNFRWPLGALICVAQTLAGLALLVVLAGQGFWATALALAGYGALSAPLTIWAQTLRMQIIPEALRGRSFALLRMLMQSGGPLGGVIAGALLPLLGLPAMVVLSAAVTGVPGLLGLQVRALRRAGGSA